MLTSDHSARHRHNLFGFSRINFLVSSSQKRVFFFRHFSSKPFHKFLGPPQFHTPLSSTHQFHTKEPPLSAPKIPQFHTWSPQFNTPLISTHPSVPHRNPSVQHPSIPHLNPLSSRHPLVPHKNPSVQHSPQFLTENRPVPHTNQFHTKNPSVQHNPQFNTKNSSVQHTPKIINSWGVCGTEGVSVLNWGGFGVELIGYWCGNEGFLVWYWGVCWIEGFLVWNWGRGGTEGFLVWNWGILVLNWEVFGVELKYFGCWKGVVLVWNRCVELRRPVWNCGVLIFLFKVSPWLGREFTLIKIRKIISFTFYFRFLSVCRIGMFRRKWKTQRSSMNHDNGLLQYFGKGKKVFFWVF